MISVILRLLVLLVAFVPMKPIHAQGVGHTNDSEGVNLSIDLIHEGKGAYLGRLLDLTLGIKPDVTEWTAFVTQTSLPFETRETLDRLGWYSVPFRPLIFDRHGETYWLTQPVLNKDSDTDAISQLTGDSNLAIFGILFVERGSPSASGKRFLAHDFGPEFLGQSTFLTPDVENTDIEGGVVDSITWSSLRLVHESINGTYERPAVFEFNPNIFKFPFVALCNEGCGEEKLASLRDLLRSLTLDASASSQIALPQSVAGAGPVDVARTIRIALTGAALEALSPVFVRLAADCDTRRGATPVVEVASEARLEVPADIQDQHACIFLASSREAIDADTLCFAVRTDFDIQIPRAWINEWPSKSRCAVPTERVKVRFSIETAGGAPLEQILDVPVEDQIKEVLRVADRVTLNGNQIFDATVQIRKDLLAKASLDKNDFKLVFGRSELYVVEDVTRIDSGLIEIRVSELFVRLGDFAFTPTNFDGAFEDQCVPLLRVPKVSRVDQEAWTQATQDSESFPDNEFVKLFVDGRKELYRVRDDYDHLLLSVEDNSSNVQITFDAADKKCSSPEQGGISVPRRAFLGDTFSPQVRRTAPPSLFVVATGSAQRAEFPGALAEAFWLASLDLAGRLERSEDAISRFETARFVLALSMQDITPLGEKTGWRPLFEPPMPVVLTRKLLEQLTAVDPGAPAIDISLDLPGVLKKVANVSLDPGHAPNVRILLIGPRLGYGNKTACATLSDDATTRQLVGWLRRGGAQVATIEVALSDQVSLTDTKPHEDSTEGNLLECAASEIWDEVGRGYVILGSGLTKIQSETIFSVIYSDLRSWFNIESMEVAQ